VHNLSSAYIFAKAYSRCSAVSLRQLTYLFSYSLSNCQKPAPALHLTDQQSRELNVCLNSSVVGNLRVIMRRHIDHYLQTQKMNELFYQTGIHKL